MSKAILFSVPKHETCPQCGAEMVIRSGKQGPFLGCSAYPNCCYIRPLGSQGDGRIIKVLAGQYCPVCQADLVLRHGRYGMFIGCSNYPECEYTDAVDRPAETAVSCPQCQQGLLVQRRSRFGKTFYACERYPDCHFAVNFTPFAGECEFCHFPLLMEKKTAQGLKRFCASKICGKPVSSGKKGE